MFARGDPLVVPSERSHSGRARRVRDEIDVLRPVAEFAEQTRLKERAARERDLGAEGAIELRRMTARLVNLEGHLARFEKEVARTGGAGLRSQERRGLVADSVGVRRKTEGGDVLVTPLKAVVAARRRMATALCMTRVIDSDDGHAGAPVDEGLRRVCAFGREEALVEERPLHPSFGGRY